MRSDELLEIIGSPTRVRMIETLSERPRCLAELSEILGVTAQAVTKHVGLLLRHKLVKVLSIGEKGRSPVKRVYDLDVKFHVALDLSDEVSSVHVHALRRSEPEKGRMKVTCKDVLKALEDLQEEKAAMKRRLKSARDREARLFEELAEYEAMQSELLDRCVPDPLERMVLLASLDFEAEEAVERVRRHMKVKRELIAETLSRYSGALR